MPNIRGINFRTSHIRPSERISFSEKSLAFLHTKLDEDIKPINSTAKIARIASLILLPMGITGFVLGLGSSSAVAMAFAIIGGIVLALCATHLLSLFGGADKSVIAGLTGQPDYHRIKDYLKNRPRSRRSNIRLDANSRDWDYVRTCLTVLFPQHQAQEQARISEAREHTEKSGKMVSDHLSKQTNTRADPWNIIGEYLQMDPNDLEGQLKTFFNESQPQEQI